MISTGLIAFMILIGLLIVLLPVAAFLVLRKKFVLKGVPILVGIAAFILFALILEQILHSIVMQPGADGTVALLKLPWLYVLYGALSAGIFEETARFLSFKLLKDKYTGIGTSLSYGIGHGGIEALLLGGMLMLNNVMISLLINAGSSLVPAETVSALTAVQPHMFVITFAERAIAFAAQVSLSVLVWSAVNDAKKMWLYPAAILLHALIDTPAILYQIGAFTNIYLVEVITVLIVVGVVVLACRIIASHRPSPELAPSDKQEHEPS